MFEAGVVEVQCLSRVCVMKVNDQLGKLMVGLKVPRDGRRNGE